MLNFELSGEEIQLLHAAHKEAKRKKDVNAAYKIHAVILLGSGMTYEEVAEVLFLNIDTLSNYIKKYKSGGIKELCQTNYFGRQSSLTFEQESQLSLELDSKIYLTTNAVQCYISSTFNIEYTISGVTKLLKRLGFIYKKPKLIPAKPNLEAQEEFLKFYHDFMGNKKTDDKVFFVDAVHPQHNTMATYGWLRKGSVTELKSNTGRSRLNIHGAMDAETYETTIVYSENTVDGDSTVDLMKSLEKIYPYASMIYMILDNAKYHYSHVVKAYEAISRVKLIYLPAYSPELNLIERLWRVFKKQALYNKFYEKYDDFRTSCINFFVNQQQHMEAIKSIMGDGLEPLYLEHCT
jgi:transposase